MLPPSPCAVGSLDALPPVNGFPGDRGEEDEEDDDEPDGVVGENVFDHHAEPGNRESLPSDEVDTAQGHVLRHGDYHPFLMRSAVGTNLLPRGEHTDIVDHGNR